CGVGAAGAPREVALGARARPLGRLPALEQSLAAEHRDPLADHEQRVALLAQRALVGVERVSCARRTPLERFRLALRDSRGRRARAQLELLRLPHARLAARAELFIGGLFARLGEPAPEVRP